MRYALPLAALLLLVTSLLADDKPRKADDETQAKRGALLQKLKDAGLVKAVEFHEDNPVLIVRDSWLALDFEFKEDTSKIAYFYLYVIPNHPRKEDLGPLSLLIESARTGKIVGAYSPRLGLRLD